MNIALLSAAGIGSRMGQDVPKQFMHVNDKPVIVYTMEAFQLHPLIDKIIVVTLPSWMTVLKAYAKQFNITKLEWIVEGGKTGAYSIYNGIKELKNSQSAEDNILIHDGDRCNVSSEIISNNLATVEQYGSAVTVIPCYEAVFERSDYNNAEDTQELPRNQLYRIQTPYTYKLGELLDAYAKYDELQKDYSAPCLMMEKLHHKIYFSRGSETNLKITTIEDLSIFKALLNTEKYQWSK